MCEGRTGAVRVTDGRDGFRDVETRKDGRVGTMKGGDRRWLRDELGSCSR